MSTSPPRRGHAAIGAIIQEMEPYLPSQSINKPGYRQSRTTYGLITTMYQRIASSAAPEKEYRETQLLERDLRRRLEGLNPAKGIPPQMAVLLDELSAAVEQALAEGVTEAFVTKGLRDIALDVPEARVAPKPEKVKYISIPEARLIKLKGELAEAHGRIAKLNEENNALALRVKKLEYRRG
jgi:hypothetical protein